MAKKSKLKRQLQAERQAEKDKFTRNTAGSETQNPTPHVNLEPRPAPPLFPPSSSAREDPRARASLNSDSIYSGVQLDQTPGAFSNIAYPHSYDNLTLNYHGHPNGFHAAYQAPEYFSGMANCNTYQYSADVSHEQGYHASWRGAPSAQTTFQAPIALSDCRLDDVAGPSYSGRDRWFNGPPAGSGGSSRNHQDHHRNSKNSGRFPNSGSNRERENRDRRGHSRHDNKHARIDKQKKPYKSKEQEYEDQLTTERLIKEEQEEKRKQQAEEEERIRRENQSEFSTTTLGNEDVYLSDEDVYGAPVSVEIGLRKRPCSSSLSPDKRFKPASVSSDEADSSDSEDGELTDRMEIELVKEMYNLQFRQNPYIFNRKDFVIDNCKTGGNELTIVPHIKNKEVKKSTEIATDNLMDRDWEHVILQYPPQALSKTTDKEDAIIATKSERLNVLNDVLIPEYNVILNKEQKNAEVWLKLLSANDEVYILKSADRLVVPEMEKEEFLNGQLKLINRLVDSLPIKDLEGILIFKLEYGLRAKYEGYLDEFDQIFEKFMKSGKLIYSLKLWQSVLKYFFINGAKTMHYIDESIHALTNNRFQTIQKQDYQADQIDAFLVDLIYYKAKLHVECGETHIVVAMLQAFTEFTFFYPEKMNKKAFEWKLGSFKKFWNSKIERIGEKNARTWRDVKDCLLDVFPNEQKRNEAQFLRKQMVITQLTERGLPYKRDMEKYVELELIRQANYWQPLKFEHDLGEVMAEQPKNLTGFDVDEAVGADEEEYENIHCVSSGSFLKRVVEFDQIECVLSIIRHPLIVLDNKEMKRREESFNKKRKEMVQLLLAALKLPVEGLAVLNLERLFKSHLKKLPINSYTKSGFLKFFVMYSAALFKEKESGFGEDIICTVVNTIEEYFSSLDADVFAQHWPPFQDWVFMQFFDEKKDKAMNLFLRAKLLEAEAKIKNYTRAAHFLKGNLLADDKELLGKMIDLLIEAGNPILVKPKKRVISMWIVTMITDFLESARDETGKTKDHPPVFSKARLLWMYRCQEYKLIHFLNEKVNIYTVDLEQVYLVYKDMFESCPVEETSKGDTLGNMKDLALKLYDMIAWEMNGSSVYEDLHKNRSLISVEDKDNEGKHKTEALFVESSRMSKFFRLERVEQLAQCDLLQRRDRYYEWTSYCLNLYPFEPRVWQHAIRLDAVNPKLEHLLPETRTHLKSSIIRLLHQAIKVLRSFRDSQTVSFNSNSSSSCVRSYLRSLFEDLANLQLSLPFSETFVTRLALLYEMEVAKNVDSNTPDFTEARQFFQRHFRHQQYSKILKMCGLELMPLQEYRNLPPDQFRWFTNVDEVELVPRD